MEKLKKICLSLLVSLFGIAAAALVAEVGFRLVESRLVAPRWSDRPPFYYQPELSPTLQDYPYTPKKPADTFRIAVIGDSFVFAPYMQFTDSFPKKLEQMLNLNDTQLKAQVINYGVPGYSTIHEVPKVQQAIKEQADLIILEITLNDPELKTATPIGITDFGHFGALQPSAFEERLFSIFHLAKYIAQRIHNTQTYNDYIRYFQNLYDNPRTWNTFKSAMEALHYNCRMKKTKIVAVVFPLFGLPLDSSYPFNPIHEKVSKLLTSLKIPHIDLSQFYAGIPLERLQVIPGVDRHPNEIGHRIAAEQIYIWLAKNKLIPDELVIKKRFQGRTQIIKEQPYTD